MITLLYNTVREVCDIFSNKRQGIESTINMIRWTSLHWETYFTNQNRSDQGRNIRGVILPRMFVRGVSK